MFSFVLLKQKATEGDILTKDVFFSAKDILTLTQAFNEINQIRRANKTRC